jgi:hypothetical protein
VLFYDYLIDFVMAPCNDARAQLRQRSIGLRR